MGDLFQLSTLLNYNENPPPDDGSQQSSNLIQWSKHTSKLTDPLRAFVQEIQSKVDSAFVKTCSGGGTTQIAVNYTLVPSDQGRLLIVDSGDPVTVTFPDPTVVAAPFAFNLVNTGSTAAMLVSAGGALVNKQTSLTVFPNQSVGIQTDGSNWFTAGGYPTTQTGEVLFNYSATAPGGTIPLETKTLGATGSGAAYEGDIYQALYTHLWDNTADTESPVAGGRGASAADDWTAAKLLTMPGVEGCAIAGVDPTASRITAASTDGGNAVRIGGLFGSETHQLTTGELPNFSLNAGEGVGAGSGGLSVRTTAAGSVATTSIGSDQPHSNTTVSRAFSVWIRL